MSLFFYFLVNFVWFLGLYVFLMVNIGCFEGNGFIWFLGYWWEEFENDYNRNEYFLSNYLKINVGNLDIICFFCVKNIMEIDVSRLKWLEGKYCIYKKGYLCLLGFYEGYVVWDDNNRENGLNWNSIDGEFFVGYYDWNIMIYYCCKLMGVVEKWIFLLVIKFFYLFVFDLFIC